MVDATNQKARPWIDQAADFHSDAIHVAERFTPLDSNNIAYEAIHRGSESLDAGRGRSPGSTAVLDPQYEALEFY